MSKHTRIAFLVGIAVALGLIISACGGSTTTGTTASNSKVGTPGVFTCVQGSITTTGSTALGPLVQQVAQDYQSKCSGSSITTNLTGSKTGLSSAESGNAQIGNSDIPAASTQSDLVDHQVAVVVFVMVVNPKVTGVTNITTDQLKGIYAGTITHWNQGGLSGPNIPIVVVSRPASSGTRATFQKYILGGPEKISGPSSLTTDSTGAVASNVQNTAGAIGYISLGQAKKSNLTPLHIDSVEPTAQNAESNTYKFWNVEHMYTKGQASGLAQALIDYMTSANAKQLAQQLSFVAITDMQQTALQAHSSAS